MYLLIKLLRCRTRKVLYPPGNLLTPPGKAHLPVKSHWEV